MKAFPLRGVQGVQDPWCKFENPIISETITAWKFKLKIQLDMVKCFLGYIFPLGGI